MIFNSYLLLYSAVWDILLQPDARRRRRRRRDSSLPGHGHGHDRESRILRVLRPKRTSCGGATRFLLIIATENYFHLFY